MRDFAIERHRRDCDNRTIGDDANLLAGCKAERGQPFPV